MYSKCVLLIARVLLKSKIVQKEEVVGGSLGNKRELEELGKAAYELHSGEKVTIN